MKIITKLTNSKGFLKLTDLELRHLSLCLVCIRLALGHLRSGRIRRCPQLSCLGARGRQICCTPRQRLVGLLWRRPKLCDLF